MCEYFWWEHLWLCIAERLLRRGKENLQREPGILLKTKRILYPVPLPGALGRELCRSFLRWGSNWQEESTSLQFEESNGSGICTQPAVRPTTLLQTWALVGSSLWSSSPVRGSQIQWWLHCTSAAIGLQQWDRLLVFSGVSSNNREHFSSSSLTDLLWKLIFSFKKYLVLRCEIQPVGLSLWLLVHIKGGRPKGFTFTFGLHGAYRESLTNNPDPYSARNAHTNSMRDVLLLLSLHWKKICGPERSSSPSWPTHWRTTAWHQSLTLPPRLLLLLTWAQQLTTQREPRMRSFWPNWLSKLTDALSCMQGANKRPKRKHKSSRRQELILLAVGISLCRPSSHSHHPLMHFRYASYNPWG